METEFNTIPFIDTTGSDKFKESTERVITINIPNWINYLTIDYKEYPEYSPLSMIAQARITKQDLLYMETLYKRIKLPKVILQKILLTLFQQIIIYTNKDLLNQIKRACCYLNKNLREDFIGISEYADGKFKSKDWVLHEALKYLDKSPKFLNNYDNNYIDGICVMMDDGVYSGTQIISDLRNILKSKVTIFITIMFMTQIGLNAIEESIKPDSKNETSDSFIYKKGRSIIYLWKGYILIPSIPILLKDIFDTNRVKYNLQLITDIHNNLLEKAGSIVVFEHKIPDYKSLPWIISNVFYISLPEHYINTPPYAPLSRKNNSFQFGSNKLKIINNEIKYLT